MILKIYRTISLLILFRQSFDAARLGCSCSSSYLYFLSHNNDVERMENEKNAPGFLYCVAAVSGVNNNEG